MQVKVWNDNTHDFVEPNFKGNRVVVPAGKYVEMDYEEAIEFKGKFSPMPPEDMVDENEKRKFYKMIRVDRPPTVPTVTEYVCQLTGKKFTNVDDYKKHIVATVTEHTDRLVVDEDAEAEIKRKRAK